VAQGAWSHYVRFVGAGTIGVAAIWTLAKLVKPVVSGLSSAMAASRVRKAGKGDTLPRTEQDMPDRYRRFDRAALHVADCVFARSLQRRQRPCRAYDVAGDRRRVVCADSQLPGVDGLRLHGRTDRFVQQPAFGFGILVVIIAALLLVAGVKSDLPPDSGKALVAFALFITSVVFAVAAIANNNLQDLKTGQLVDATPWRQQVALVIGVIAGAIVIPPVLDLLNHAYGFLGAPGVNPAHALPAPQAGLISALAQGVIQHNIDWSLITVGGLIGAGIIILDELLGLAKIRALAAARGGLGIYLPTSTTLMIVVGAIVGWYFDKRADRTPKAEATKQLGVLLASGMIVGESIIGVLVAAIVVFSGKATPLALVGDSFQNASIWIGGVAFAAVVFAMYRWIISSGPKELIDGACGCRSRRSYASVSAGAYNTALNPLDASA
jgi:uncharacterized oligopeptide transporter (OPT) family protein